MSDDESEAGSDEDTAAAVIYSGMEEGEQDGEDESEDETPTTRGRGRGRGGMGRGRGRGAASGSGVNAAAWAAAGVDIDLPAFTAATGGLRVYVCACVCVCVCMCVCSGVSVRVWVWVLLCCVLCAQPDDDEGLSRANHSSRAQPDAPLTPVTHTRPAFRCRSVAKGDPPWKSTRRPGWEPMSGNVSIVRLWRRRPLALRGSATVHWVIALPSS
jgi:hypothetical protein